MQSIGLPQKALEELNRILYRFIWQRRYANRKAFEKVKRSVMENDFPEGGVRMVNVFKMHSSFYIKWAIKLCTENKQWTLIPLWQYSMFMSGINVFRINNRTKHTFAPESIKSEFWRKVLSTYLDSKTVYTASQIRCENILKQVL